MENVKTLSEVVDYKKALTFINAVWTKSFWAVLLFVIGLWIGADNTENRIVADCKFAGSFRAEIQAFACQRKI